MQECSVLTCKNILVSVFLLVLWQLKTGGPQALQRQKTASQRDQLQYAQFESTTKNE